MKRKGRSARLSSIIPYGIFLFMTLFLISHVLKDPSVRCAGSATPDLFNNIYTFEWFYRGLIEKGEIPIRSDDLLFPDGGSLFLIDPVNALISLPVRILSNPIFTRNFIAFFVLLFDFMALFLLVRGIHGDTGIATLSSILGTCSAYVLINLHNWEGESINIGFIALFILFLERAKDSGKRRDFLKAGLFLFLTALSSWYYGFFVIFYLALFLFSRLLPGAVKGGGFAPLLHFLEMGLLASLLILPFAFLFLRSLLNPDSILNLRVSMNEVLARGDFNLLALDSIPLKRLLLFTGYKRDPNNYIISEYLGFVTLFLGLFSITLAWRKARFYFLASLFFLLLSLGPILYISDSPLTIFSERVKLPFYYLARVLPLTGEVRFSRRAFPFFLILLILVISLGLRRLLEGRGRAFSLPLLAGVALLHIAELSLLFRMEIPLHFTILKIPRVYEAIKSEPGEFGIIDLPVKYFEAPMPHPYTFYQTFHGKGIPYGIGHERVHRIFYENTYLLLFNLIDEKEGRVRIPEISASTALFDHRFRSFIEETGGDLSSMEGTLFSPRKLREEGFRFIVVHKRFVETHHLEVLEVFLSGRVKKVSEDGDTILYRL